MTPKKTRQMTVHGLAALNGVVQSLDMIVLCLDSRGIVRYMNPAAERMTGYKRNELIGRFWFKRMLPGDEQARVENDYQHMQMRRKVIPRYENSIVTKSGDKKSVLWHVCAWEDHGRWLGTVAFGYDVTDQRVAEGRLRESTLKNKNMEFIINESQTIAFLWRAEKGWPVEYVSKNIERYGYEADDFLSGRIPYANIVHPDDLDRVGGEVAQYSKENRHSFSQEYRIITREKNVRWIIDHTYIRRNEKGRITHYQGLITDVTDMKTAAEGVRTLKDYLNGIIDSAPLAIFDLDLNGHVKSLWNPSAERMFGWKAAEVIGRYLPFIPEHKKEEFELFRQRVLSGENFANVEAVRQRRDGTPIHINIAAAALSDSHNQQVGIIAVVDDITDRKLAEQFILSSRDHYKKMFDEFPALIWKAGTDAHCNYFNRSWLEFTGRTMEQEKGDGWAEGVHPEDLPRCLNVYRESFSARKPFEMEYRLRHRDGTYHTIVDYGRPFDEMDGSFGGYLGSCYDVTDRKKAEKEVWEAKKRYEDLVENLPVGVYRNTPGEHGHFLEANEAIVRIFEAESREEFMRRNVSDLYGNPAQRRDFSEKMMKNGFVVNEELALKTLKGKDIWCSISAVMKKDEKGQIYFDGLIEDITGRRRTRERLEKINRCFLRFGADPQRNIQLLISLSGELFSAATALYHRIDSGLLCGVAQWNAPAGMKLIGKPEGRICYDVLQGPEEVVVIRNLSKTPYRQTDPNILAFGLKTYIGKKVRCGKHVIGTMCLLYREDYEPTREDIDLIEILGGALGIEEERREGKDILQETNRTLETMLESSPIPITMLDVHGRVKTWNDSARRVLGWTAEELYGKYLPCPLVEQGINRELLYHSIINERVPERDIVTLHKSGRPIDVRLSAAPVRNGQGKVVGYVGVFMDLSERKKYEQFALQSEKMSSVGQLAAGIAHEINNPLGIILGFSQSCLRRMTAGHDLEFPLKSIERESLRCRALVQDLLLFSRTSPVSGESISLNEIIRSSMTLIQSQAKVNQVDIVLDLPSELPLIFANRNQIQQILINLSTNALDAMSGGGTLTLRAKEEAEGALPGVVMMVEDTGSGIPPDILQHIFDPFFTTKEVGKGTGLGLSLVYEMVKKHAGTIDVMSVPGYTVFKVKFPLSGEPEGDRRKAHENESTQ